MTNSIVLEIIILIVCISCYTMCLYDAIQAAIRHERKAVVVNCVLTAIFIILMILMVLSIPGLVNTLSSL